MGGSNNPHFSNYPLNGYIKLITWQAFLEEGMESNPNAHARKIPEEAVEISASITKPTAASVKRESRHKG